MKSSNLLPKWFLALVCGCAPLHAQMPAQPQISFTDGSSGTWNADWDGVANRTYFVQYSLDLVTWGYAPLLRHGADVQSCGIQTENADKFFVRLRYADDPAIDTLVKARLADFDGDGIPNAVEVEYGPGSDPFDINSVGPDTDGDGMPDAWEYAYGLNPNSNTDANGDMDGDGLTNLQEYQAHTKPNYYDTDGDHFSDGFELGRQGYDPLVANASVDTDGDGVSDLDELYNGTNPQLADSDGDGVNDYDEIQNGSDPNSNQSTPFVPSSYFGPAISEELSRPMGDLGVSNYSYGSSYNVAFDLYDSVTLTYDPSNPGHREYATNQEQWRLKIGNNVQLFTDVPPTPGFPYGGRAVYLDPNKVHEIRLENLGVSGLDKDGNGSAPDYQHSWSLKSKDFIPVSSIQGNAIEYSTNPYYESQSAFYKSFAKSGSFAYPQGYNWTDHVTYLIPIVHLGYSTSYTGGDATGPRFRKISHLGRPVPDVKPEAESETDEAAEESYVDAFDLSLHHDTSFASIPLAASDLRLEANASVRETTWSSRSGLRPNEEITSPFGIGWSSNLCAYIETTESMGSFTTRPTTVSVVDESGRGQRFGTSDNMTTFFAWPSSLTDKKTYLNTLTKVGNDLVLQKKFGNKLTYRPCDAWFMYCSDRLDSSPTTVRHRYWRLEEVVDRYGVKVEYDYGNNAYSLIPAEIRALNRTNQKLVIGRSTNGRRVTSITDPLGNVTQFHYDDATATIASTTFSYPYQKLSRVEFPGGAQEHYTYEVLVDPEPETIGTKVTRYLHGNLNSIQRDGSAQKVFTYAFDRSKKWYDHSLGRVAISASLASLPAEAVDRTTTYVNAINKVPQSGSILRVQYGLPRIISMIQWPTMNIQSLFAKTSATQTTYGPSFSSTNGTDVTDAEGKKYTYTFGGTHGEIIETNSSQSGGTTSASTQWMIYHANTTLEYKTAAGGILGTETFEFDPNSGLSLKRTVDFSGNETNWLFDETRPAGPRITLENNPNFLSKWSDPTMKTDALNRVENYEYGNFRMLSKQTDIHGSVTEYTVDALGRRTVMTVTDAGNNLLQKETYNYDNSTFPGFMTRKTRKAFSNLSGQSWEQDLVVEYVPDSYGRVWKEKVDPSGKNLITTYTYDLNNRKLTTTDARSLSTTFEHDGRSRLGKVTYADSTFKTYGYDDNNAKIRETDENGNSALIERDTLGRITKSARDMNGDGLIGTGDFITQFGYDKLGLLRKKIDPRGFATVTFYDDLHRPQHVFNGVPEASADSSLPTLTTLASSSRTVTHEEFSYNVSQNTGGGLLNPSKPTGVTRHNVVSTDHTQADATLQTSTVYDDVYRPISTSSEYSPGLSKTTQFDYGTVNTSGREPLVSTMTDSLGKVTRTTVDALGRESETIDGFGNSNADLVLTTTKHYTSTGLLWRVIDPLSRHSETEYDSVGRPVKVYQPDPSTGLVSANSPVTESEYDNDGNVLAVIDPLLRRTDFDYNNRNRKWRIRQAAVTDASNPDAPASNVRPTTTVSFDDVGNEIAVADARGSTTRKFYDKANRVFKIRTNPQSGSPSAIVATPGTHDITNTTEYDNGGLVLSVEDGNGNITRNAYDSLGRLIATVSDSTNGNPATLPASGLDPASYRSSNPTCALVSYLQDDSGNIIEVTDGGGHQTAFTFDGFNRKTGTIWDPSKTLQRTEIFAFNALVQTSRVDGKGRQTNYGYDGLYRLVDVTYPGTSNPDNRHVSYDKAGKVLSVTYPNDSGSIRNVASVFDKLDRLTSETSAGVTHTYPEYDKVGNRKQTTYGRTGTTLVSTYDALNRLETCEERSDANTPSGRTTSYAYDLGGNVTRKTLPNGNATTTTRDKLGHTLFMVEKTSALAVVSSFDYSQAVGAWPSSHDGLGNVLRCAENHTMASMTDRVVTNTYDHSNRLDTETITPSGGTALVTGYGYDLADNRISKTVGSTATEYKFGNGANGANSNQLREYGPVGQTATHTFTHDNNGNRETRVTSAGTETYTWNDENRLTALDTPGGDYAYTYDHRGRRVIRDESAASGSVTELTFVGGTSVQEANGSGTVQVELIRGSDWGGGVGGVLFTIRSGQRSYNGYNSRGDVVSTSDGTGTATWQASYEAFGTRTEEDGSNAERQRANTKDEDPTGLLNEGLRYRDLEAGVFISRDPAGFIDGPNVYAYVNQNPWSAFDPEGLGKYSIWEGGWAREKLDEGCDMYQVGVGGSLASMGNSAYNDVYGEVESSATQGAYLANQTGSTVDGIGYAGFSMIGGKNLMEADQSKELTFAADGGVSSRRLSAEEVKANAISGTLKLGASIISAVAGGISTTRTMVGMTEKLAANFAKKEAGQLGANSIKPGQTMSAYPQERVVGGRGESPRLADPPAGMRESGAWDPTPENITLMERGRPPVGRDGLPVELHHRNQSPAGPLDQITSTTHDTIPHPISPSQINRNQFSGERSRYWRGEVRKLHGKE